MSNHYPHYEKRISTLKSKFGVEKLELQKGVPFHVRMNEEPESRLYADRISYLQKRFNLNGLSVHGLPEPEPKMMQTVGSIDRLQFEVIRH